MQKAALTVLVLYGWNHYGHAYEKSVADTAYGILQDIIDQAPRVDLAAMFKDETICHSQFLKEMSVVLTPRVLEIDGYLKREIENPYM